MNRTHLILPTFLLLPTLLALGSPPATQQATQQKDSSMQPTTRRSFDAAKLHKSHPPILKDPNKKIIFALASPENALHAGTLEFSRWPAATLPDQPPRSSPLKLLASPDFFQYPPVDPASSRVEWHLNFADPDLFAFYSSRLLAQDELQVAEHPILASLREALLAEKQNLTTIENSQPTPILIKNAQRRLYLATDPNPSELRPSGLYGNRFAKASPETLTKAAKPLDPPTLSNIIAIAAPRNGRGPYTADQIHYILQTAYTAFSAARLESQPAQNKSPLDSSTTESQKTTVIIHTGFWGCGAFGGDRVLMLTLQILAAHYAQIDELHIHTGDKAGLESYKSASALAEKLLTQSTSTPNLLQKIEALKIPWGTSDGN